MAYFRKLNSGSIRAEVERAGSRSTKTFSTMQEARKWASEREKELTEGVGVPAGNQTLVEAIRRYVKDVSARKASAREEALRFEALIRDFPAMCSKRIADLTTADLAAWRDARLKVVASSTVAREATPLRHLLSVAAKEWQWIPVSPWTGLKLPQEAAPRVRRTSTSELKRMLRHLGYVTGRPPQTKQQQVAYAWLIAQHTAMRAGEVMSLSRSSVNLDKRVARLEEHKTVSRDGVRLVPFTRKAARLMRLLAEDAKQSGRNMYFSLTSASLDALFRKAKGRLLIEDLHFHDSRADALTRLAKRVDVLTLAKISGHRDLSQLLNAYYRETAEDIASRL